MLWTIGFAILLLLPAMAAEAQPCAPNGGTCEVPCFEPGICIDGTCETGQPIVCEQDGDVCTVAACNPENGLCEPLPTDSACDDGSPCTVYDQCVDGACTGQPLSCDDGDPCTADRCDDLGAGCVFEPIPACGAADVPTITLWPKVLLVLGFVAVARLAYRRSR